MNYAGKTILNKLIAIIAIFAMTVSDFALVGTNFVSYAIDMAKTTSNNVEFSSYFVDSNGDKVKKIEKDINAQDLKMYVEIAVKNEGYFDGQITLGKSNFKINNASSSQDVRDVSNNTVYLNRIKAGATKVIELNIEKDIPETIQESILNMQSEISLTGKYTDSKKTKDIEGTSNVELDWKSSEDAKAETTLDLLTNKIYTINGESKRIVQILLTSKMTGNNYPVKSTIINLNGLKGAEDVEVYARNTDATSRNIVFSKDNYKYNVEEGTLRIVIENNADSNGNITFDKDATDEFVVTYIYGIEKENGSQDVANNTVSENKTTDQENANNVTVNATTNTTQNTTSRAEVTRTNNVIEDLTKAQITASTTIVPYDNKEKVAENKLTISEEKEGIVTYDVKNKENAIYKGKIYTGEDRSYTSIAKINVNKANIAENIKVNLLQASYIQNDAKYAANSFFTQTKINKAEFEKIFGTDGYIKVINQDGGKEIMIITNATTADENGNIVISYEENIKAINIETSKPISEGILSIENTKTIKENAYERNQIKSFTQISEAVEGAYNDAKPVQAESSIILNDTSSKASLNVSNKSLSTTETTNSRITVILETENESKDLYKNPTIKVTLPSEVRKLEIKYQLLHGNGLTIADKEITRENDMPVITFTLSGEQTKYVSDVTEGPTLVIDASMELDSLATSNKKEITVNYTNENATTYQDGGIEKETVDIIAKNPIIATHNISELNIETAGEEEIKSSELAISSESKQMIVRMDVINNEASKISDVKILGQFPTNSSKNDLGITLETLVVETTKQNATMYYSTEENPSSDLNNKDNKWTKDLDKLQAKSYLIVIDSLEVAEKFTAAYKINIPANLTYNLSSTLGYSVSYKNEATSSENSVKATTIELNTGKSAVIEQTVVAQVGGKEIKDGDVVKAGEIITYTVTIKNNGNEDATGVNVVGTIPEGTNYIEYNKDIKLPEVSVPDNEPEMFVQDTNKKQVAASNITIKAKSQITLEYMVKVNTTENIESGCEVKTTYNGKEITNKITHKLETSDIELTMLKSDSIYSNGIKSGYNYRYTLKVKNTSNKDKKDVQVTIDVNDLLEFKEAYYTLDEETIEQEEKTFTIEKIKAGEEINVIISLDAKQPIGTLRVAELSATASIEKDTYRSNKITENVDAIVLNVDFKSTSTSKSEGYLHKGDEVTYTINIKNVGENDANSLEIRDQFSDYLELKSVTLNGETSEYDKEDIYEDGANYSIISIKAPLRAGENATVVITANVSESLYIEDILKIVNNATIYNEVYLTKTEDIVYYVEKEKNSENIVDENGDNKNDPNGQGNNQNGTQNDVQNGSENQNNNGENTGANGNGETSKNTYTIIGTAWKDANENGQREASEELLSDINVSVIDVKSKKFLADSNGNKLTVKTNSEGLYTLSDIPAGKYILVFEYDTEKYMLATYQAQGVATNQNSDVIQNTITIDGATKQMATTDTIEVNGSIANIDIGLVDAKIFDLELQKYVSKIVITNNAGTTTYEYNDSTLAKAEIAAKNLSGSQVVVEYTIKAKNNGELAGYIKNIVDYKSSELNFSSTLNSDWYQKGEYLYNASLADTKIEPGETKEIKLILTKTMTESNTGLINNTAEIAEAYNARGIKDVDSTVGNKTNGEDDTGAADVIIGVKTGAAISYILLTLSIIIILAAGGYIISKKVLSKEIKFE